MNLLPMFLVQVRNPKGSSGLIDRKFINRSQDFSVARLLLMWAIPPCGRAVLAQSVFEPGGTTGGGVHRVGSEHEV